MAKKALITGITGQDGAYLAQLLLAKGYKVHGAYRRSSTLNLWRLQELGIADDVDLVCMELTDQSSIQNALHRLAPDEIYNLAAQSFVAASFDQPVYTGDIDGLSVTRLLETIRSVDPHIRYYQASTSEMFGKVRASPQNESTPFYPRSPYGVAKLYAHWITINYRESYNLYACSGILFNHESPLRGLEFVTRKITSSFAAIHHGALDCMELGNLDARRDWGFAGDYVEGVWNMLQQKTADDYVLSTGTATTIREFVELTAKTLGIDLVWKGEGISETGLDRKTGKVRVTINPHHYRPAEVDFLVGDPSKAAKNLGWKHKVALPQLVEMMLEADLRRQAKAAA